MRAATRGSKLALWQTYRIGELLGVEIEPVIISTTGDIRRDVPIAAIAGQGIFVKEVQAAVLDGRADIAVHSAKDLPSTTDEGLVLAAVPERGDPRDALVGSSLEALPQGATVATGAPRRRAQLASLRPDLRFEGLRGNVETRLEKSRQYDAIVMAFAPILRLEMQADAYPMSVEQFVPQVGQGALAVECAEGRADLVEQLQVIEHAGSRRAVDAERSFLARLGGGCELPVGAYATVVDGAVHLDALLASFDGSAIVRRQGTDVNGVALGRRLAETILDDGGRELLEHRES
jgi:hydroxymethylbilane synthase